MKRLMMLTLPNSRSDWFAELLAKQLGRDYYQKEFFNPITNQADAAELVAAGFGCELPSAFENIASPIAPHLADRVLNRSGWDFDKETYSAWHADWFLDRFNCFVLERAEVLPASRLRVLTFYDAIYSALVLDGRLADCPELSLVGRCRLAHGASREKLRSLGLPVISSDVLVGGSPGTVAHELEKLPLPLSHDQLWHLTGAVLATRQ